MDENAIRQWFIDCFGPIQGEMAWNQFSNMPEELRDQLMSQDVSKLPKPAEVRSMMQAFTAGGLNTFGDIQHITEEGPINVKLAKSLALQQANGEGSETSVSAEYGEMARRAISEANLWLDTACEFNPAQGETQVLTRAGWVEGCIDSWAQFASPIAKSMSDALASILSQRFGDSEFHTEISGIFAGPVQIPIPDDMKDPAKLMRFVGNTSFAMQLGRAAGDLSHEVRGSFDQSISLLKNPAGGLIVQNVVELLGELVGIGQVGKLPQIQNPPDFDGFARLVGDAVRVFAQHLRHAGTHHAVTQNRYINHADDHPFLKGVAAYLIYS